MTSLEMCQRQRDGIRQERDATDYLGGCCYESADQFVKESLGYFEDMRRTVVDAARATITKLAQSN